MYHRAEERHDPLTCLLSQQEAGQRKPLKVMATRQHCPEGATHTKGPPQSAMDMRAMPPAPAAPTSPSPPRIGAMPAVPSPAAPTPAAAAAPPTRLLAMPVEARRAKPPEQRVTIFS